MDIVLGVLLPVEWVYNHSLSGIARVSDVSISVDSYLVQQKVHHQYCNIFSIPKSSLSLKLCCCGCLIIILRIVAVVLDNCV